MRKKNINTVEYWDNQYNVIVKKNNHIKTNGIKRSIDLMKCINICLSSHVKKYLNGNRTILDVGCGIGAGSNYLYKKYKTCKVSGYDFSKNALSIGMKKYENIEFINDYNCNYDVIVCSHILQLLDNPIGYMKQELLSRTNKYLIILVPFEEDIFNCIYDEHVFSFKYSHFEDIIIYKDFRFKCLMKKILISKHYAGKQLFVLYENMGELKWI